MRIIVAGMIALSVMAGIAAPADAKRAGSRTSKRRGTRWTRRAQSISCFGMFKPKGPRARRGPFPNTVAIP
jgi:hypothetical protein